MENSGIGMKRMGMKTTTLLMFFFLALAGCSSKPERTDYMKDAAKGRPLEMPPDLILPKTNDKYVVPDGGTETSSTYSEYIKSGANQGQACTCKESAAVPQSGVPAAVPQLAAAVIAPPRLLDRLDGSKSILISEPFDRCWLKVSLALDQAAIAVEDKDRSRGVFYLKSNHNQLSVQARTAEPEKTESCEVSASNATGASSSDTRRIIDALYKNLNK
jgi:uncharacterized lipoprotein